MNRERRPTRAAFASQGGLALGADRAEPSVAATAIPRRFSDIAYPLDSWVVDSTEEA
jgi:hypothetical protein